MWQAKVARVVGKSTGTGVIIAVGYSTEPDVAPEVIVILTTGVPIVVDTIMEGTRVTKQMRTRKVLAKIIMVTMETVKVIKTTTTMPTKIRYE